MGFARRRSRLGLLLLVMALPLLAACDPDGEVYEITDDLITGWACDLDTTAPITVDVYATNAAPQPGFGCLSFEGESYCGIAATLADRGDDSVLQRRCGNRARAFELPTPAVIKDGQNHKVIAFGRNVGSGQTIRLRGTAIEYPATIYRQPPIMYLDDHILQATEIAPGITYLFHVFPDDTSQREVGVFDHLYFTYYAYGNWQNPVNTPWPDPSIATLTGFPAPPNPSNPSDFRLWQRGRWYTSGLQLLQGFGGTFGALLTQPEGHPVGGMVAIHNFRDPKPRPWLSGLDNRLRMEAHLRVPTDSFLLPGHNTLYFTLVFLEIPLAGTTPRTLWFGVKLYETNPAQSPPEWQNGQGYAGALMPASPAWVTPCGQPTTSTPFSDERLFCFEMSVVQWLQVVAATSNAPGRPGSLPLTLDPTRWQLASMNVNAESWAVAPTGCPNGICTEVGDAQLGFSMRDFKLSVVH